MPTYPCGCTPPERACGDCHTPPVLTPRLVMPNAAAELVMPEWIKKYFDERLAEILYVGRHRPKE